MTDYILCVDKFIDKILDCLNKFFQGDLGEYEKYPEDIYNMANGTPKGKYQIDEEVKTMYGTCNKILIIPRLTEISICMNLEN